MKTFLSKLNQGPLLEDSMWLLEGMKAIVPLRVQGTLVSPPGLWAPPGPGPVEPPSPGGPGRGAPHPHGPGGSPRSAAGEQRGRAGLVRPSQFSFL